MNDAPSLAELHHAMEIRTKQTRRCKESLGEAIRAWCQHQPLNKPFEVAGHRLEWIEARCQISGGLRENIKTERTQTVLLLNGRLVSEPDFAAPLPGWDQPDLASLWYGPVNGWYREGEAGTHTEGDIYQTWRPLRLETCKLSEMSDVANALPTAMAAWYAQEMSGMEARIAETDALTNSLRTLEVATV